MQFYNFMVNTTLYLNINVQKYNFPSNTVTSVHSFFICNLPGNKTKKFFFLKYNCNCLTDFKLLLLC